MSGQIQLIEFIQRHAICIKNRKHYTTFRVKVNKGYSITGQLQDLDTRKTGTIKKKIILDGMDNPPKTNKAKLFVRFEWNNFAMARFQTRVLGVKQGQELT